METRSLQGSSPGAGWAGGLSPDPPGRSQENHLETIQRRPGHLDHFIGSVRLCEMIQDAVFPPSEQMDVK